MHAHVNTLYYQVLQVPDSLCAAATVSTSDIPKESRRAEKRNDTRARRRTQALISTMDALITMSNYIIIMCHCHIFKDV